jgi:hypothetical protein
MAPISTNNMDIPGTSDRRQFSRGFLVAAEFGFNAAAGLGASRGATGVLPL